jgi:hypothetical protein
VRISSVILIVRDVSRVWTCSIEAWVSRHSRSWLNHRESSRSSRTSNPSAVRSTRYGVPAARAWTAANSSSGVLTGVNPDRGRFGGLAFVRLTA